MPEQPQAEFLPDLSSIDFPSNRITVAQVQREQPELFYSNRELTDDYRRLTDAHIVEVIRAEHIFARQAWAKAIGLPDPHPLNKYRREEIEYIDDLYKSFGLSTGRKQTTELVRSIEAEAARLATLSVGQGRG